jgi:hypothetical protein
MTTAPITQGVFPHPVEITSSKQEVTPLSLTSQVLAELKKVRHKERSIKNFGRFLVSFGTTVAVVGVVIGIAGALLSSPVGWAVGVGVVGIGLAVGLSGIILFAVHSRHTPIRLIDSIKSGIVSAFTGLSMILYWAIDSDSVKKGHESGVSGAISHASWLMSGLLFNVWIGKDPGKLSVSAIKNKDTLTYQFVEDEKPLLGFKIPLHALHNTENQRKLDQFIEERVDSGKKLVNDTHKTDSYETVVLPSVRKGKFSQACDVLWVLYNSETDPEKKRDFAVEIAALTLRAKKRTATYSYFTNNKEGAVFMLISEIAKNPDTPDPRLLIAYNQLTKLS